MRWLTNFYDFRFKGIATAAIGIHPTKAWLSQLVNFKNAIWTRGHFKGTMFPKIRGYCHETIEEMKEAVTKLMLPLMLLLKTQMYIAVDQLVLKFCILHPFNINFTPTIIVINFYRQLYCQPIQDGIKLFWHAHTHGLPWGLLEAVGMIQQVHCSRRRLFQRGVEFHVCTINKSAHTKKIWKLI